MRLLLVEDEPKLGISLKKALESESYSVDLYTSGEDGYTAAGVEDYDCIILDVGLPDMDGLSIAKTLRQEKNTTPILMLTARDTQRNKIQGLDSGADDYMIKPFDFDELLARIRALLRRNQSTPDVILTVGSLSLDPSTKIVTRSGKTLSLRAKEYALLEYLIRHKESIVTKTQLLEHVWDIDIDPFSNVVDVYIGYLRKKIDKDFPKETPVIRTIKGLGYKLEA